MLIIFRSSHRRCPVKKVVLEKFANITGKYLYWSQLLIKLHALGPASLFTKTFQHRCFPVKFAKLLRILILKNICERLLLYFQYNSHYHFHYHHFHYHYKMHLYPLRILLTIPFDCNMILSVSAKFCLLSSSIYFSLVLFQVFIFYVQ